MLYAKCMFFIENNGEWIIFLELRCLIFNQHAIFITYAIDSVGHCTPITFTPIAVAHNGQCENYGTFFSRAAYENVRFDRQLCFITSPYCMTIFIGIRCLWNTRVLNTRVSCGVLYFIFRIMTSSNGNIFVGWWFETPQRPLWRHCKWYPIYMT